MREEALKNRTAIMVHSECRINPEVAEKLEMKDHHTYLTGISPEERESIKNTNQTF